MQTNSNSDFDQQIHGAIREAMALEAASQEAATNPLRGIKNRIRRINTAVEDTIRIVSEQIKPEEQQYASLATHKVARLSINTAAPRNTVSVEPSRVTDTTEQQYAYEQPTSQQTAAEVAANPVTQYAYTPPQETTIAPAVEVQEVYSPQTHEQYVDALTDQTDANSILGSDSNTYHPHYNQAANEGIPFDELKNRMHSQQVSDIVAARGLVQQAVSNIHGSDRKEDFGLIK